VFNRDLNCPNRTVVRVDGHASARLFDKSPHQAESMPRSSCCGERPEWLRGECPAAATRALFRADGAVSLDVRLTLRIHDDALAHMPYGGHWITQIV